MEPETRNEPAGDAYVSRTAAANDMLPVAPNLEFMLRTHPKRVYLGVIDVDGKDVPYWLPKLVPFPIRPGVLGVQTGNVASDGAPRITRAIANAEDKDWVFLKDMGEYLRQKKCKSKNAPSGTYYFTRFEAPTTVAGSFRMIHDDQAYFRWVHQLTLDGRLPTPHPEIIRGLLIKADQRMNIQANKEDKNRYTRQNFERFTLHYENMKTAIVPGSEGDPLMPAKGKKKGAA